MSLIRLRLQPRSATLGALTMLLAANLVAVPVCADAQGAEAAAQAVVGVQTIASQPAQIWSEFSGRMEAVDYAEIRPQVAGRITEVRVHDGQSVAEGDILFVIDPRPYAATLARAEANLEAARANAAFAKTELDRAAKLIKGQAIAQQVYDQRVNAALVTAAAVRSAEADVQQAQLDVDHAYVKAPIAGRVSRPEITLGNLVQAGPGAPLLTSIVSRNGIYAAFEVDEQTYLRSVRGQDNSAEKLSHMPVELTAAGDRARVYRGTVYSFDNRINASSGTIRARARFANEDGSLVPGMFVSVRLASSDNRTVTLVADRAVATDQNKKYVFVVGPDNTVIYREITLGEPVGAAHVVLAGLKDGERVIVDGQGHLRPDQRVQIDPNRALAPPSAH